MDKITLYRLQDHEGRGPYRPGFSDTWIDPDNDGSNTPSAVYAGNCTNEIHKAKEVIQTSEVVPVTTIVTKTLLILGKEPIQSTP